MATPMTPSQLLSQLNKWGVKYKEFGDWKKHNRNHVGPWGPVNGFMWHHTGSNSTDQRSILYDGYSDLPGPLSHFGIAQNGIVWLIGWGRANHAGGGDPNVFRHVVNESYDGILKPHYHQGSSGAVDGNTHFYGVEIWYSGTKSMTPEQYKSALLLSAAILDFHKWTEKSVIGHGEWSDWKWDPGIKSSTMMNMANVRKDIASVLKNKGVTMASNPPAKSTTYKQVWETDAAEPPKGHKTNKNPYWWPMSLLKHAAENAEQARKNTEKIMKHLGI